MYRIKKAHLPPILNLGPAGVFSLLLSVFIISAGVGSFPWNLCLSGIIESCNTEAELLGFGLNLLLTFPFCKIWISVCVSYTNCLSASAGWDGFYVEFSVSSKWIFQLPIEKSIY